MNVLIKGLLSNKDKLADAISSGGYCPGDFSDESPSLNKNDHCIPERKTCIECWIRELEGKADE